MLLTFIENYFKDLDDEGNASHFNLQTAIKDKVLKKYDLHSQVQVKALVGHISQNVTNVSFFFLMFYIAVICHQLHVRLLSV